MRITILILILSFFVLMPEAIAQENTVYVNRADRVVDYGIGLGSAIAIVISWSRNGSVLFAIIHGLLSWLYIIYYLVTKNDKVDK